MQENLEPGEEEDPLEEAMATHSSILAWKMPMDRGAWQAAVSKITQSQTQQKQLSTHTNFLSHFFKHLLANHCLFQTLWTECLCPPKCRS